MLTDKGSRAYQFLLLRQVLVPISLGLVFLSLRFQTRPYMAKHRQTYQCTRPHVHTSTRRGSHQLPAPNQNNAAHFKSCPVTSRQSISHCMVRALHDMTWHGIAWHAPKPVIQGPLVRSTDRPATCHRTPPKRIASKKEWVMELPCKPPWHAWQAVRSVEARKGWKCVVILGSLSGPYGGRICAWIVPGLFLFCSCMSPGWPCPCTHEYRYLQ